MRRREKNYTVMDGIMLMNKSPTMMCLTNKQNIYKKNNRLPLE